MFAYMFAHISGLAIVVLSSWYSKMPSLITSFLF